MMKLSSAHISTFADMSLDGRPDVCCQGSTCQCLFAMVDFECLRLSARAMASGAFVVALERGWYSLRV